MKKKLGRRRFLWCLMFVLMFVVGNKRIMAAEVDVYALIGMGEASEQKQTKTVNRGEFAKMLLFLSGETESSKANQVTIYPDVRKNTKNSYYINTVSQRGWLSGDITGKFHPQNAIQLKDAARAVLALLNYQVKEDGSFYSQADIRTLFYENGLNKDITTAWNGNMTYKATKCLFYNTWKAKNKASTIYFETLGGKVRDDGTINTGAYLKNKFSAPITGTANWKSELPFSSKGKLVYVNGVRVKSYKSTKQDVVYYDTRNNSIWVYQTQVEGTLQSVSPSARKATTMTVDGEVFSIGTDAVKQLLAKKGDDLLNSKITLLLGVNDEVAGILSDRMLEGSFTGVILKLGIKNNTSKEDNEVVNRYMIVADQDAKEHTIYYDYKNTSFRVNDPVKVTGDGGEPEIETLSFARSLLNGKTINSDGSAIGDEKLADSVKLIDIGKESAKLITWRKLEGIKLSSNQILYFETNETGEISTIYFNNIVGREDQYVLITKILPNYDSANEIVSYTVSYYNEGTEESKQMAPQRVTGFLQIGSVYKLMEYSDGSYHFEQQNKYEITGIDGKTMNGASYRYTASDEVQVYYKTSDGNYYKTTLDKVKDLSKFKLYAYYNKDTSQINTVWVILAQDR
ncbi:MAG: hypothetical protein PWP24_201 [Clostridiales bacterium]|nr:hypothetical protein [Clostridiales bacterium]